LELILCPSGAAFHLPAWSALGGMIVANGGHEPNEIGFMIRAVRAGDSFLDVGANIGIYAALMTAAGAYVVAFEPDSTARLVLERNVDVNRGASRGQVLPYAIANKDGTSSFSAGRDVASRLTSDPNPDTSVTVPVARLDSLLSAGVFSLQEEP